MHFSAQLLPPHLLSGFSSWLCRGHSCLYVVCGQVVVRHLEPRRLYLHVGFVFGSGVRSKCRWLAKLPWVCSRLAASSVLCVQGMWSVHHTPQGPSRFHALPLNFCLFLHCQPPLLGPQPLARRPAAFSWSGFSNLCSQSSQSRRSPWQLNFRRSRPAPRWRGRGHWCVGAGSRAPPPLFADVSWFSRVHARQPVGRLCWISRPRSSCFSTLPSFVVVFSMERMCQPLLCSFWVWLDLLRPWGAVDWPFQTPGPETPLPGPCPASPSSPYSLRWTPLFLPFCECLTFSGPSPQTPPTPPYLTPFMISWI